MAKDPAGSSSWWGMPRVISSLWTSPEEEAAGESEKENMEELVEKRRRSIRERDVTPFDRKEATENRVVRSHSSKSRSRSRSSSGSVKVSKAEAQVPSKNDENISVEISNISFSFFNEENKQDLALLNNHSTDKPESPVPVVEALQVDKLEKDPDESDDLSFSSTFSSPYDKVQKKQQEPTVQDPHTVEYSVPKRSPSPIYSSISKVTPGRGKRESAETGTPRTGLDPEHDQQLGDPDRLRPRQSGRTQLRGHRPEGVDRFWRYVRKWWVDERAKMHETLGKYRKQKEKPEPGPQVEELQRPQVESVSDTESFDTFTEDEADKFDVDTHVSLPLDIEHLQDYRKSSLAEVSLASRPVSALSFKKRSLRSLIVKKGALRASTETLKTILSSGEAAFTLR
ncbi:unnamed protein product [Bemisia tabaci]|uniref:Uncharacterized protein n=1 Tax=Bemisia tabaci TaxID=7038 RepID=A0A9P0A853_BEMTA|nr:unnamed protein product [Bemisia tabaci]